MTTSAQLPGPSSENVTAPPELEDRQRESLDVALAELTEGEQRWTQLPLSARVEVLRSLRVSVAAQAENWALTAARSKQLAADSPWVGEEWMSGPYAVLSALIVLETSVAALAAGRSPLEKTRFGQAPGGRVTVPVLPLSSYERILLHGFRVDTWMPPGRTAEDVRAQAGLGALRPDQSGGIGVVLGAGNISSIPALDVLYALIAENRVSLLKLNPVMADMLPVFEAAFAPLIRRGALRIVSGGGDVGAYLTSHRAVTQVHITGSAATHDVVVFGPGADGARRKAAGEPLLDKPITSELGGVSPIIVVPGAWSNADLRYQAEHVVTQRLHNGGYNCIAGQVVLLSSDWPQKEAFRDEIRSVLRELPARAPWYPGSDDRLSAAADVYPDSERLGSGGVLLLADSGGDASMARTEYFSPVLGMMELAGSGQRFLDSAVKTVNEEFLGTLGANVLVAPETLKELGHGFDRALEQLRYGTIAVNAWTALGFLTAAAPWGAYPGHTVTDVQSGIGVVHNALLLDAPEKTVVRGPFRPFPRSVQHGEFALFPKPPWFVTSRSAAVTGRLLTGFAAKPGWLKLPGIFAKAFRA